MAADTHGHCVLTANNDCCVRLFDVAAACRPAGRIAFPYAVNYASVQPGGVGASLGGTAVAAVVGDDPVAVLVDCRSGLQVRLRARARMARAHRHACMHACGVCAAVVALARVHHTARPMPPVAPPLPAPLLTCTSSPRRAPARS